MTNSKKMYAALLEKVTEDTVHFLYVRSKTGGLVRPYLVVSTEDFITPLKRFYAGCYVTFVADNDFKNIEVVDVYAFQEDSYDK